MGQLGRGEDFVGIVERMTGDLRRVIHHISARELRMRVGVEDLVQDVQICVWRNAHRFQGTKRAELLRWISAIARHTVLNANRYEFASKRTPAMPVLSYDGNPLLLRQARLVARDPADLALEKEQRALMRKAAAEVLSREDWAVIHALYYQDLTPSEVARRERLHPSTLRARLRKILERIRQQMRSEHGAEMFSE